jgi:hypothetical protein
MMAIQMPSVRPADVSQAFTIAIVYVIACSLIREPARRNFNAIMIAGAGAAYLSGGGLGPWELVFTAVVTFCAYEGLNSYRFIGVGWLLHTVWDIVHHLTGHPLLPFAPSSSAGCAITDALLALWFFADAPSAFRLFRILRATDRAGLDRLA